MILLTSLVLLSTAPIFIEGQTEVSICGRPGTFVNPLITLTYETKRHWPWHAAIYHKYSIESNPIYQCGGTVISSKFILTAAHCVEVNSMKLDITNISVHLGRRNLGLRYENTGQSFEVADIIVHQEFNSIDYNSDIAIIKLSAEAQFNNFVKPACLWSSNRTDIWELYGMHGTVVGWGLTEKGEISNVLRQAALPVVSWSTCLKSNRDVFGGLLSNTNYCAGFRNGTIVCQGDSGGAMTFEDENGKYYIRGIVSVSPSRPNRTTQELLCDPSQYAFFTDVAQYLPWIRDKTCETMSRCNFSAGDDYCAIEVHHHPNRSCKIILNEPPNEAVTNLLIIGEFDVIPDLSDAVGKFENLEVLWLANVKLKIVERSKLTIFGRKLSWLILYGNEITQLDADTFDDLKNLVYLNLRNNNLTELHVDLFKELANLEAIYLNYNQIKILPQGLFRNNKKLKTILLIGNKLKKIEFQFDNMPNLHYVDLRENVCINEYILSRIEEIIRSNCTGVGESRTLVKECECPSIW